MWLMLQPDRAEDDVVAANRTNTVRRECVQVASGEAGLDNWEPQGPGPAVLSPPSGRAVRR